MKSSLQKNISLYLAEKNMSVSTLEKQAGLKPSAIQNILHGRSKKPSLQSICAVASILGCTVEDLVREGGGLAPSKKEIKTPWDPDLYIDSVQVIQHLFKKYKVETSKEMILSYVDEVYSYSSRKNQHTADKTFAEWCVENWLLNKKPRSFLK